MGEEREQGGRSKGIVLKITNELTQLGKGKEEKKFSYSIILIEK